MMRNRYASLMLALLMALLSAACGGSGSPNPGPGPGPGPDLGFTRLVAMVTDASGAALPGLSVRVDGQQAGLTTDASGQVVLTAANFPNGINTTAELAFGKGGIVLGTRDIVPAQNPNLDVKLGEGGGTGTASVSGVVYDASRNGIIPMLGRPDDATNVDAGMIAPSTLDGVEITLFDAEAGAVFQTKSANGGQYSFDGVAAGAWQMSAQLEGYYPEMAAVRVEDGGDTPYDFAMTAKGAVTPGEGIHVSGILRDSVSGAPIAGATVNVYADTGYAYIDPMPGETPKPDGTVTSPPAPGDPTEPAKMPMMSQIAPDYYRPQYQTTTTGADGSFSFPDDLAGYTLWLDFNAPNYLAGNHYEDIYGRTDDLTLELELAPVVPSGIHGRVVNGSGNAVAGARVEFIFGGGFMGGGPAVPGFAGFEDIASDGSTNFDNIGAPPPGKDAPPSDQGSPEGWGDSNGAPAAGGAADPGTTTGGGDGFDNGLMQRFLWEQQQKGGSDVAADFSGYVAVYTDANGDYSITDVPAGPYYVMASAYKHLPYAGEAEIGPDEANNDLDITLPEVPVGSVEGTVTNEDGDVVPDVLVNATQPNVDPFTYTDASGHFRIDNVPAGDWLISAFKSGYLTASSMTTISEDGVLTVNLQLQRYDGPDASTIAFGGSAINGFDNSAVGGADIVFTPVEESLGGYARHILSGTDGGYSTTLVPNTDYNVLIQKSGFEDIFFRFWIDEFNPRMDFWLWPVGAPGGGGGGWNGGGGGPRPGDMDPATGGGSDGSAPNG